MLRTYIFNESNRNWVEEESNLLYHDLCAILDEENFALYLWNGPKSSKERLESGYENVEQLMAGFPDPKFVNDLQVTILTESIPPLVQKRIDIMLKKVRKEQEEELQKFSRLGSIKVYFICAIIGILAPIISILNLMGFIAWKASGANVKVAAGTYQVWLLISIVLMIIALNSYIINFIVGLVEKDSQATLVAIVGFLISIGILLYLNQGVFLFLFESGSSSSEYVIAQNDLWVFFILNVIGVAVIEVPNIFKFMKFLSIYKDYLF